jgi:hypothetical protein
MVEGEVGISGSDGVGWMDITELSQQQRLLAI